MIKKSKILTIRGMQVMLDRDLAELYGLETKALNQAVKRNIDRFPSEFMFRLDNYEKLELATNCYRFRNLKHSSSNPYAFTEQGVAMRSSLKSGSHSRNWNWDLQILWRNWIDETIKITFPNLL